VGRPPRSTLGWICLAGRYEQRKVKAARERQVGNFPQAFSHLTLILAAHSIAAAKADEN
jgi:hypothetical protein